MKKLAAIIVKNRKLVLIITLILVVASVAGILYTVLGGKINSDLFKYLPEDSNTVAGLDFMEETFGIKGDAMMVIEGDKNDPALEKLVAKIKGTEGVSQFIWVGDMWQADKMLSIVNGEDLKLYEALGGKINYDVSEMIDFLYQPVDPSQPNGKYNYVMLGMLDYAASTTEARDTLLMIKDTFASDGREVVAVGMTNTSVDVLYKILGEMPYYIVFAFLAVIIILLLTTDSFIDPIVLLVTLGVSIVVSMGTNLLFKDVSIISFALSSVLQLAVTMDYAIFYMHLYKEKRRKNMDSITAAAEAAPDVWSSILASCLTTVGGFFALFFMHFTLGADLGKVLVKAVLCSLACVVVLQPALTVLLDKAEQKTRHKFLSFSFKRTSKFVVNKRVGFVILAAILILPVFILQNFVDYSYFQVFDKPTEPTSQELLADKLYNQTVVCVPVLPDNGTHNDYIADLKALDRVDHVIGAFAIMDVNPEAVVTLLDSPAATLFGDYVGSFFGTVEKNGEKELYTMYTITVSGSGEDAAARELYYEIRDITSKYFDDYVTMGMLTGVTDMAAVTPTDFLLVSGVSIAIIFAVLLLLLLSVRQSVLLVALIELGIWLNLSFSMLIGQSLNFMVYVIISSVQLGCTVDYAILMTSRYREFYIRYLGDQQAAAKAAARSSLSAITVSASIIIAVCLAVYFVSGNMIVQQMTGLLARGGFVSYLLVMFVLPGLLTYTKPAVTKRLKSIYKPEAPPPELVEKSKNRKLQVEGGVVFGENTVVIESFKSDDKYCLKNDGTYGIIVKKGS